MGHGNLVTCLKVSATLWYNNSCRKMEMGLLYRSDQEMTDKVTGSSYYLRCRWRAHHPLNGFTVRGGSAKLLPCQC